MATAYALRRPAVSRVLIFATWPSFRVFRGIALGVWASLRLGVLGLGIGKNAAAGFRRRAEGFRSQDSERAYGSR